jgi:drug/metabolite transporter (DMT)-like permease
MLSPGVITVGSEVALALYPILIKLADQNLFRQLLTRFATFFIAAAVFAVGTGATNELVAAITNPLISIVLGAIYILHVASSYIAFKRLDAGSAMSLFYTYPFWNLLAGAVLFKEKITMSSIILLAVSLVGVYLVSKPSEEKEGFMPAADWRGIVAGLTSALTESGVFAAMRLLSISEPANPAAVIAGHSLLGAGVAAAAAAFLPAATSAVAAGTAQGWLQMVLFNAIIGFGGYALRMYVIPRLSTATFSILSVIGAAAAFFWGWLYAEETPTIEKLVGAALITGTSAFVL